MRLLIQRLIFMMALVVARPALAATAAAVIDKTQGRVGDQFVVTLTITGKVKGQIEPPVIDGCDTAQAGVSHNMQWINGEFSSEDQYSFVIQPRRAGTFTVPSWKLKVEGEDVATLPIKFTVSGGGAQPPANPQKNPQIQGQNQAQNEVAEPEGADIFIERDVPSRAVYVGEAFVSVIRVFHKIQITSASPKRDSAPEFRVVAVPGDKTYQRIVNGVRYQVIEFKETLIPLRPGSHTLPPYRLQATVFRPSQKLPGGSVFDFFSNQFFGGHRGLGNLFGREENVEVKGKPVPVSVVDLPATGQPADFTGLVGEFALRAAPSARQVTAGESVNVEVALEGTGSLDGFDLKDHVAGPGSFPDATQPYKTYPEKPELKEEFVTGVDGTTVLRSRKRFNFAVVPQVDSGAVELGAIKVPFFDPVKGAYEVLEAQLGRVEITPGTGASAATRPDRPEQNEVKSGRSTESGDGGIGAFFSRRRLPSGLITLLVVIAAAGVAAVMWRRMRGGSEARTRAPDPVESPDGDLDAALEGAARGETDGSFVGTDLETCRRLLAESRIQIEAGKSQEALACLEHASRHFISARIGRNVDAMTPREIRLLPKEGSDVGQVPDVLEVLEVLEQVEAWIFSQRDVSRDQILGQLQRVENLSRPG